MGGQHSYYGQRDHELGRFIGEEVRRETMEIHNAVAAEPMDESFGKLPREKLVKFEREQYRKLYEELLPKMSSVASAMATLGREMKGTPDTLADYGKIAAILKKAHADIEKHMK